MDRNPPPSVKRILRQEVGFGCPICRSPFLTWHHFDPTWARRQHHNPNGMIALCTTHHPQADQGIFSKSDLRQMKRAKYDSASVIAQFQWMRASERVLVRFAGVYMVDVDHLIVDDEGRPIVWLSRNEENHLTLSFDLYDSAGEIVLSMRENSFENYPRDLHDVSVNAGANSIGIWFKPRDIGLALSYNRVSVEELKVMLEQDRTKAYEVLEKERRRNKSVEIHIKGDDDFDMSDHLIQYVRENCLDDEELIPLLNFDHLALYQLVHQVIISNGMFNANRAKLGYSAVTRRDWGVALTASGSIYF